MPRAAIDLGSNSILLLVVDDQGQTLHDEVQVVGLGRGLGDGGRLRPDRVKAAMAVLAEYARTAQALGVPPEQVRVVATSAMRRAEDAGELLARVSSETGLCPRVVKGEEEALLTWRGAFVGLEVSAGLRAVVDVGGGSTEVIEGRPPEELDFRVSLEIGSVRLTERYFGIGYQRVVPAEESRMRAYVDRVVATLPWVGGAGRPEVLVAVAGTATTLASMAMGLTRWDRDRVHGFKLGASALARTAAALREADARERRRLAAVSPERADHLLAGAIILDAVRRASGKEFLVISDGGVRHGLVI